jgi:CHAT domain-containing protein/tetratricopeptide (TPR) repeat protein
MLRYFKVPLICAFPVLLPSQLIQNIAWAAPNNSRSGSVTRAERARARQRAGHLDRKAIQSFKAGHYRKAINHCQKSLDAKLRILDKHDPYVLPTVYVKALSHLYLRQYATALRLFKSIKKTMKSRGMDTFGPFGLMHIHYHTAQIYLQLGLYDDAALAYEGVLKKLKEKVKNHELAPTDPKIANTLNALGQVYHETRRYKDAERCYREALRVVESARRAYKKGTATGLKQQALLATTSAIRNNLGMLYAKTGRYAKGRQQYEKALALAKKAYGPDHPRLCPTLHGLGATHHKLGSYSKARRFYDASLKIKRKVLGPNHPMVTPTLLQMSQLSVHRGRHRRSLSLARRAFEINQRHSKIALGAFSPARRRLSSSLLGTSRGVLDSILSLARYLQNVSPLSRRGVRLAFEALAERKGLGLNVGRWRREEMAGTNNSRLRTKIQALRRKRLGLRALLAKPPPSPKTADQYKRKRRKLQAAVESLQKAVDQQSETLAREAPLRDLELSDIHRSLKKGEVLVEIIRYRLFDFRAKARGTNLWKDARYAAFVVTGGRQRSIRMKDLGLADRLDREVSAYLKKLTSAPYGFRFLSPKGRIRNEARLRAEGRKLYDKLIKPLGNRVKQAQRVFFDPDGTLGLLPMEALWTPRERYLIEEKEIVYLASPRDLVRWRGGAKTAPPSTNRQQPKRSGALAGARETHQQPQGAHRDAPSPTTAPSPSAPTALVIADPAFSQHARLKPLSFTRTHGVMISSLLKRKLGTTNVHFHAGESATEESIVSSHRPRVVHISTHGIYEDSWRSLDPLNRSWLALAGADDSAKPPLAHQEQRNDGRLFASEVMGIDLLGTELVMLVACNGLYGKPMSGEGVSGLRRAFLYAGARSLIGSLFVATNGVADYFTRRFYEQWLALRAPGGGHRRKTKSQILRHLKLERIRRWRKQGHHTHPFYWAGFVLVGDPR